MCKKIGWGDRWFAVDPFGKSEGLLLGWGMDVTIHQIRSTNFSIEVDFEIPGSVARMWAVFVYASNKNSVRLAQWQELTERKKDWGSNWVMGGDFNDIRSPTEKVGGRIRTETSCQGKWRWKWRRSCFKGTEELGLIIGRRKAT